MARTKKNKPGYQRRAAERAAKETSMAIDTNESLKSTALPIHPAETASTNKGDVLAPQHDAGVSKRKKKQKPLKRQQRLRKEKGIERAESVVNQLENKISKSKRKGKTIKSRSAAWEDLNEGVELQQKSKQSSKSRIRGQKAQNAKKMLDAADRDESPGQKEAETAPEVELPDADSEMPGQNFLNSAGDADDLYNIG